MQPSWRVSVKSEGQGSSVSLSARGHVGDFTVDRRPRWLQRMSRERTNCELHQSSIGSPRNGFTKAATPSVSLAKSLFKRFSFTLWPVSGFIFPLTKCTVNTADRKRGSSNHLLDCFSLLSSLHCSYSWIQFVLGHVRSVNSLYMPWCFIDLRSVFFFTCQHHLSLIVDASSPTVSSCLWRPNSTCCTTTWM